MTSANGVVLVDKPQGWTSHDVVGKLRGLLRERRIGHAGTLDPMATGLLVVAVGPATRLLRFAQEGRKTYEGTIRFGVATDSLDADGTVVATSPVPTWGPTQVADAARAMLGPSEQIPPMVSAIKIEGKKLYELAREGKEVERAPRPIEVTRFDVTPTEDPASWHFSVEVTPGTYVRVLAADLAERLGTLGHLTALRRTASGGHSVSEALTIEALSSIVAEGRSPIAPPSGLVAHLPVVTVDEANVVALRQGKVIARTSEAAPYVAAMFGEELVAVLRPRGEGWQPDVVLATPGRA